MSPEKRKKLQQKYAAEARKEISASQSKKKSSPATSAPAKPSVKPAAMPKYKIKDNEQSQIFLYIERGNRLCVRWPAHMDSLTTEMENGKSAIGRLLGKVETLRDGSCKKLTPLNYWNARKILVILSAFTRVKLPNGHRPFKVHLSDEFEAWYDQEDKAERLCDDAHHLLEYDDTIQTGFEFLRKPLYPWQSAGMRFLNAITRHGKGAFVCDETGLGKTYTVTSHLAGGHDGDGKQPMQAVVVAPAGVNESWYRKVADISNLSCTVIGSKYPINAHEYDIIVVSYAMLKKRGLWPISEIIQGQNRVLILDEGHYTKNYDAKRTSICLALAERARHTLIVTATPLKNREKDLHPLLRMTRRLWTEESMDDFSKYYTTEEGRADIAERLSKFMLRRMFAEVKPDFPTGEVGEAYLELSNRETYDEVEKDFIQWLIRNGAEQGKIDSAVAGKALVKLNKLRQLSAEGKMAQAADIIRKTLDAGEQCIVFCAFNDPLYQLAETFKDHRGTNFKGQEWHGSAVITGKVSKKKRYKIIDDFMAGKTGLLCIGTVAGGLGIDLPIARFAYFLDLPWSPADFEQCTGRILRLGQERDCQFIKLLAAGTIDQRMEEIIQTKATIFQEAIGDMGALERVTAKEADQMRRSIVTQVIQSYIRDAAAA